MEVLYVNEYVGNICIYKDKKDICYFDKIYQIVTLESMQKIINSFWSHYITSPKINTYLGRLYKMESQKVYPYQDVVYEKGKMIIGCQVINAYNINKITKFLKKEGVKGIYIPQFTLIEKVQLYLGIL